MTPTYGTWIAMKRRCEDPRTQQYRGYGARGIHVCESWHTFENFLADMGERPPGTTIDRIDVNGNYEPGNCRWATAKQQSANRRPVKPVIIRKLTDHQADELRRLRAEGYTYQSLGERFGIAMTTAYGYVNGRYDRPPKP